MDDLEALKAKARDWMTGDPDAGTRQEVRALLDELDAKPGAKLEVGKAFGTVESVKAVSDLFAPVAGTIVAINPALNNNPCLLYTSPSPRD